MNIFFMEFRWVLALINKTLYMDNVTFNTLFRKRTINLSLEIMKFYSGLKKFDEVRIMGKQLIRCVTSVGANFRAACVARSTNEKYSKYCIVVEEADEMILVRII